MSPIIMKAAYQTYLQKEICLKNFEIEKKVLLILLLSSQRSSEISNQEI